MRRLVGIVLVLVLVPSTVAFATDLEELLERSQNASYVADLAISCSTPDGVRDAVIRFSQHGGQIRVGSTVDEDIEVTTGSGGWALTRRGGVVSSAAVDSTEEEPEPLYLVEDLGPVELLGRGAMAYRLVREEVLRAELIFDDESGALMAATTFSEDGTTYCQRQFVSINTSPPRLELADPVPQTEVLLSTPDVETELPETVFGFERLDLYEDEEGFRFSYYSDGFFSFAVFETPGPVELPEGVTVQVGESIYRRAFTVGQATYAWETRTGGMALIGDLPPDMHEAVLTALPGPDASGWLTRLWRRLFG